MKDWIKEIEDWSLATIQAESLAIEKACEEAIQGGEYGVFVLRFPNGRLESAEPHSEVPYGMIFQAFGPLDENFWERVRLSNEREGK